MLSRSSSVQPEPVLMTSAVRRAVQRSRAAGGGLGAMGDLGRAAVAEIGDRNLHRRDRRRTVARARHGGGEQSHGGGGESAHRPPM